MTSQARIGRTIAESTPAYHPPVRPPDGAPNVVVILLDDTGFAQLGCFGSDIATPNMDRLAARGLRYNRFHVTALCSPTRACLLTGRNHHAVGMGFLSDLPTGFPGYDGRVPSSAGTMARILRDTGYSTVAVGKWHLAPRWEQSAAGPFERWPLGLGFERYYGFLGGDTNQWTPELVSDNHFVDPPATPDEGYHLTEDLADEAIRAIQDRRHAAPDKPFFLYFATGATHAPHHAPPEWIDRYRGQFDDGWEAWRERAFARQLELGVVPEGTTLTERPPWVSAWDRAGDGERRLYARQMEAFAGFLSHTDHQIGRVIEHLERTDQLDNTLVLLMSDNGASAEGGPTGSLNEHRFTHDMLDDLDDSIARVDQFGGFRAYNHYAWGWAWAGNAPLKLWKRYTWLGGVRTPLIAHWPDRITAAGEIREQFCHVVDLMPTVLDAIGITAPAEIDGVSQQPIDGASLLPTFTDANTPSPRSTQYFEMIGSRAIYHDGWKATTDHVGTQMTVEHDALEGSHAFDDDHWALYDLREDFAESDDVAERHPERVRQLTELWWAEAGRNQVLPLEDSFLGRAVAIEPPRHPRGFRSEFLPGAGPIPEDATPLAGGFRLLADIEVPDGGAEGIISALGDWHNGWASYLLHGRLVATFNLFGHIVRIAASEPIPPGAHTVGVEYRRRGQAGGTVTLLVDGDGVADGQVDRDLPFRWQIAGGGMLLGRDRGFPVCDDYRPPFAFSGTLERVVVELLALAPRDDATEVGRALHHE